jgi:hypothetical protein
MPAPKNNKNAQKKPEDRATSFLYLNITPTQKSIWVREAQKNNMRLTAWATQALNAAVKKG